MEILKASHFILRPWKIGDEESLVRYGHNRNVSINLRDSFPHPYTLKDAQKWIEFAGRLSPTTKFAIELNCSAIGGLGLILGNDIYRRSAEIKFDSNLCRSI
ncbi:MAG: hypothetical protein J0L93_07960 [Deltaproteobacteria bacterium]|nr:hypothetical protein [Deltaproteobacteria bacterium]